MAGMELALSSGVQDLIVEGDLFLVTDALNKGSCPN